MLHEAEAVGAGTMASNSTKILPTCQERGQSSAAECWKGMQVNPVLCKSKKKKTLTAEWMQWMDASGQPRGEKRFLSVAYGLGKYRSDLAIWILGEAPRMSNECRLDVLQR